MATGKRKRERQGSLWIATSALPETASQPFYERLNGILDGRGFDAMTDVFGKGVKIDVSDMLPSSRCAERQKRVPPAWEKAFEINRSAAGGSNLGGLQGNPAARAAVTFVQKTQKRVWKPRRG